jgi:carboxypeptidase Q
MMAHRRIHRERRQGDCQDMHRIVSRVVQVCLVLSAGCAAPAGGSLHAGPGSGSAAGSLADRYRGIAGEIIRRTMESNDSWRKMEELCDGIGHRLSGSPSLERAVAWAAETLRQDGQEHVRAEPVQVPHWVRGEESLVMVAPREEPIAMIGLGGSVGTPPEGITAPVVCVRDEKEFEALAGRAAGRIVLFNNPMPAYDREHGSGYGHTVRFRGRGPGLAAGKGAVACLVRSVTARSLRSPHTGATRYPEEGPRIPAAAISTEDAEMISRLLARGEEVRLTLKMQARTLPDAPSANVIGELRGHDKIDEIVVIGGHLDSWDVGQGAHDDAAGVVMCMEALNVLRKMGLRPRRTIRVVLFTNEENGLAGGRQYAADHASELPAHVAAIECDAGGFRPEEITLDCADPARQAIALRQLQEIAGLLAEAGGPGARAGGSGADIGPMKPAGFPLMGLHTEGSTYFDYHHSHADTLDKVNPRELSQCVAVMAVLSYVIADMPDRLGAER